VYLLLGKWGVLGAQKKSEGGKFLKIRRLNCGGTGLSERTGSEKSVRVLREKNS